MINPGFSSDLFSATLYAGVASYRKVPQSYTGAVRKKFLPTPLLKEKNPCFSFIVEIHEELKCLENLNDFMDVSKL